MNELFDQHPKPDLTFMLLMLLAMGTGTLVQILQRTPNPLPKWQKLAIALSAITSAILAAKIPFVMMNPTVLRDPWAFVESGKTITFALVGGYAGVEGMKWAIGVRTSTGDAFAVSIPIALAIGRVACFHAGCCYGIPTQLPWAIIQRIDNIPRHPTQFYEVIFHLSAAIILWQLRSRGIWKTRLFETYLISYFVFRFLTEYLRPEPRLLFNLTLYQFASLAFIPLFVFLIWEKAKAMQKEGEMLDTLSLQS